MWGVRMRIQPHRGWQMWIGLNHFDSNLPTGFPFSLEVKDWLMGEEGPGLKVQMGTDGVSHKMQQVLITCSWKK